MRLLDTLQRLVAEEASPFRAQLAREDVARCLGTPVPKPGD